MAKKKTVRKKKLYKDKVHEFTVLIHGDVWAVRLISNRDYETLDKANDGDSTAQTDITGHVIYFKHDDRSLDTVFHETGHAYLKYLYLNSTSIDVAEYEEIICEWLPCEYVKYGKSVYEIHAALNAIKV